MTTVRQTWAVTRYEFRMQIRKRSLWITTAALAVVLTVTQGDRGPRHLPPGTPPREVMAGWALLMSILLPIGFGMVLADRLTRDRRLGLASLLESLPTGRGALVAGKYLGGLTSTAVPAALVLLTVAAGETTSRHDPALFAWAAVAFALITLPGLAFVTAFALVCPLLTTAPLFRVLFVGYWFWGNMLNPDLFPSLTGTLLTPLGDYPATWLMGERALYAGADGWLEFLRPQPGGTATTLAIALLLLLSVPPLALAPPLLRRRNLSA